MVRWGTSSWGKDKLKAARKKSFANQASILKSEYCGCFDCGRLFKADILTEEDFLPDADSATAWCPYCGTDTVIGDHDVPEIVQRSFLHELSMG